MDDVIQQALENDQLIDITTTGRKTGRTSRKEIWFHSMNGRVYITGTPVRKDWYANMMAHPDFIFHLKQSVQRDIPARATPITDMSRRREIFAQMVALEQRMENLLTNTDTWVESSPLVEVDLLDQD